MACGGNINSAIFDEFAVFETISGVYSFSTIMKTHSNPKSICFPRYSLITN